jgi:hypothetical protein
MRRSSESGGAKGLVAFIVVLAVCAGVLLAGRAWLSRYGDPDEVAKRLGDLIGSPVTLEGVEPHPMRRRIVLSGFTMDSYTSVESATLEVNPGALLEREWVFGDVNLYRPVWVLPSRGESVDPFTKGLLLPLSLATRARSVSIDEGMLLGPAGQESLAVGISGRFARTDSASATSPVEAELEWVARDGSEVSLEGTYFTSESSDTVSIKGLRVSADWLELGGRAIGSFECPAWARAELATEDFCGGSLRVWTNYRERSAGPVYEARIVVSGADGAELLWDKLETKLMSSGSIDADFVFAADALSAKPGEDAHLRAEGDIAVAGATIDPSGPLGDLVPLLQQGGVSEIESAAGHVKMSYDGIVLSDVVVRSAGMTWSGSGTVRRDRTVAGALLGRIPAGAIAAEGTAVALIASMLAGRDGRIPAAFSVGGTLEKPVVAFDVDRTADAIAAAGVPQAKELLMGLSPSDKDQIARAVERYLEGANRN